jgi:hypothetical protein
MEDDLFRKPVSTFRDRALLRWGMIFSENRLPLFGIMLWTCACALVTAERRR